MRSDLAALIDHTLLRAEALPLEFERLCADAAHYSLATVCVNSTHVWRCRHHLRDSPAKVAATVGFPLGAASIQAKTAEARQAILDGADEIDMVGALWALKSRDRETFITDVREVVDAAAGRLVKVTLETGLLRDDEKRRGAAWVCEAGASFVKTSTGFGPSGATAADVRLLRAEVGDAVGVKASGGIRDAATADAMVAAGASRIGTSAGVAIVTESRIPSEGS
ncbi:MAG: deoxyribose-phosphate aldolase [Myxococcota bacterium]